MNRYSKEVKTHSKMAEFSDENNKKIASLNSEQKTKIWIKTLLNSYKYFPNIIKTIDKIIEMRASTISFSSDIFNSSKSDNQIEYIIDMSERKKSLVNIYVMISKFFKILPDDMRELAEKKFFDKCTNEDLAIELGISIRTVYRKILKIIDEIYSFCVKNKWSVKFIELQIGNEEWLIERFNHYANEFIYSSSNAKK